MLRRAVWSETVESCTGPYKFSKQSARTFFFLNFRRVRKIEEGFVMSVHPSACHNSAPTGWILMKFGFGVFLENVSRKFKYHYSLTTKGTLPEDTHTHTYIYIQIHIYTYIHICVCVCIYIYIYTHTYTHTHTHTLLWNLAEFFSEWVMFQTNVLDKIETHILLKNFPPLPPPKMVLFMR